MNINKAAVRLKISDNMNKRLQEIIRYKTGGRKRAFAELVGWSPPYLTKLLNGVDFGLSPVLTVIQKLPEINARWFLTGEGQMLTEERRQDLRRETIDTVQRLMDYERLIPVMTPDELSRFERLLTGQAEAVFSPDTLSELSKRAEERMRDINARIAAAAAKSEELCRQRTAKKS